MKALIVVLLTVTLLPVTASAQAVVTSTADDGSSGTLRYAINHATNGETITFTNTLSGQTILLTNGQFVLTNNLTVDGSALSNRITLNGNQASRIFTITNHVTVLLNSLIISNGNSGVGNGGGIYDLGALTVSNCIFSGNSSAGDGGGIGVGNFTAFVGALWVYQSTFVDNTAGAAGGGIFSVNYLVVNNSTFTGNIAQYGGGIYNAGQNNVSLNGDTVNQSTFYGNSEIGLNNNEGGGAIYCGGGGSGGISSSTLTLNQCTVVSNTATGYGGGIYAVANGFHMTNCIVAGNTGPSYTNGYGDISGPDYYGDISTNNCIVAENPQLAPLGNYGGSTQTAPPLFGSPAIDAGSDSVTNMFATDQRGYPRLSGLHVDIGAVEAQFATNPPVLQQPAISSSGTFTFSFTNQPGGSFTVLASTNAALPLNQWSILGLATEIPISSGQFQFADPSATNAAGFYYVHSP